MDQKHLEQILLSVSNKELNVADALKELQHLPFDDIGYANIDQHRALRIGHGEVVYGAGKTPAQCAGIVQKMLETNERILLTRSNADHFKAVSAVTDKAVFYEDYHLIVVGGLPDPSPDDDSIISVVTAGTSDIPVAEEAAITCEFFGNRVDRIYDVGVAGIHRLLSKIERIQKADVIIVVAGMEGALASVVAGLVKSPVIAVPTSVGYGASLGGLAALLSMLNSCADGVGVVNIDNGYGAACLACKIHSRQ